MASGVYSALKNLAASGQYVLSEITEKIDALWAEGKLTDAQRVELTTLAQANADPNFSPMTEVEKALDDRLFALEAAMLDVGELLAGLMAGGDA